MASSPPGVDMIRSWILVTDCRPPWLHSEPEDGDAVREPIGAVEKWPGRWFSEAIKYLFLLFWMSLRSEPTARERKKEQEEGRGHKQCIMGEPNTKQEEDKKMGKEKEQRGRKINVRHTLNINGLRHTTSIMVSYSEQQFSLQGFYTTHQLPEKTH